MGTAMGTPMAPNYANLFMAKFEEDLLENYYSATGHRPLVWFRYIDDIFMIWTSGNKSLDEFLLFSQNFSQSRNMKSVIRFEINKSDKEVNFLDVKVGIENGSIRTSLFNKPTDAHLYLNCLSDHPEHVIRNIPKGQFIRIRRICSEQNDYMKSSEELSKFFVKRGFKPEKRKA